MKKIENVQILTFGTTEANGYTYDIDLCQEIAKGIWLGKFRGFTKDSGKTITPSDAITIIDIRAEVQNDILYLIGSFECDEEKLPKQFKNFFDKAYRIVVETTNNELDDINKKLVVKCQFADYLIEVIE